mmetsp:Transcript_3701/g.11418  ORF Transcript_3701/g.11418 Transcript_3701/m.11418 type:complete len:101 (-) Transcript_3701:4242-4544(-)|eukprot:scaffold46886_cov28-Tisochrysis_lutea.AAC.11
MEPWPTRLFELGRANKKVGAWTVKETAASSEGSCKEVAKLPEEHSRGHPRSTKENARVAILERVVKNGCRLKIERARARVMTELDEGERQEISNRQRQQL